MATAPISSCSFSSNNTSSCDKIPFYKLKITLNEMYNRPRGGRWRRVVLPANFSLLELHVVIQVVFGWENYHLHKFMSHGRSRRFGWLERVQYQIKEYKDDFLYDNCKEERLFKLSDIFSEENPTMFYEYDYGQCWEHEIKFEGILESSSDLNYPTCVDGKGENRVEDGNDCDEDGDLKPEFQDKKFNKQQTCDSLRKLYEGKWPHNANLPQCYLCAFPFCYGSCSSCNGKCCSYCLKAELLKNPARLEESDSEDED